jgi:hypothetical protein
MDDGPEHIGSPPVSPAREGRKSRWAIPPGEHDRPRLSARRTLVVPVKAGPCGSLVLRTGRLASGEPTGLAFTSESSLARALGPAQRWTILSEPALRALLLPLGVGQIRVDPYIVQAIHTPAA